MTTIQSHGVTPLDALRGLVADVDAAGIRFCHWKSNAHLAAAVRGETDLDLLVDRDQAGPFRDVLHAHDFKPLIAAPGKHYPAVENFLGYDLTTGRLIHLHVHYQLVLGQQFVKDYRIPIEDRILDSTRHIGGVPVPAAEVELIILSIRVALKYRIRDAIKDTTRLRGPGIPRRIVEELNWLMNQTSTDALMRTLSDLPEVPDLVLDLLDLELNERRGLALIRSRQRLRASLRPFRRTSRVESTALYLKALARKRSRSLGVGEKHKMTLRNGGISIALVGADGAGKSTLVGEIHDWLSWRLDVATCYMGTSESEWSVRILKRAAKAGRAATRRIEQRVDGRRTASVAAATRLSHLLIALRRVEESRRKLQRHNAARKKAARGSVVLFDRFPLLDVPVLGRSMDGPRLHQETDPSGSPLLRRLLTREADAFQRMLPPDRLLALRVTPEISLRRKPDHDAPSIEAKSAAVEGITGDPSRFAAIDAGRPLEEVLADAKAIIWAWL